MLYKYIYDYKIIGNSFFDLLIAYFLIKEGKKVIIINKEKDYKLYFNDHYNLEYKKENIKYNDKEIKRVLFDINTINNYNYLKNYLTENLCFISNTNNNYIEFKEELDIVYHDYGIYKTLKFNNYEYKFSYLLNKKSFSINDFINFIITKKQDDLFLYTLFENYDDEVEKNAFLNTLF